ncbi:MAG: hypothetical protein MUC92_12480 [Fimbriimonadaceae bacterium]|nr:hypothetical protein [Fimbriimonadaceae bacterium]
MTNSIKIYFAIGAIVFFLVIAVWFLFGTVNVAIATARVAVESRNDSSSIIRISEITPFHSMYGSYWIQSEWDKSSQRLVFFCVFKRPYIGRIGPVNGIELDSDLLPVQNKKEELAIYILDGNGQFKLLDHIRLKE